MAEGWPFVLGLTGSIGMGKSAVAAMFAGLNVPVFDADAAVHDLQGPEGVNRGKLGAAVFGNRAELARLEDIVHPAVARLRAAFLAENAGRPLVVFDIPLLFEKGGQAQVDAVVVVSAPAEVQRERVLARPGMTAEKFAQILALQVPDAEKRARADHVIDTGTSLAETRHAVQALVHRLTGGE